MNGSLEPAEVLTQDISGADKLDKLRNGHTHVVSIDLLLQSSPVQQRVMHLQRSKTNTPTLNLTNDSHKALQPCPH